MLKQVFVLIFSFSCFFCVSPEKHLFYSEPKLNSICALETENDAKFGYYFKGQVDGKEETGHVCCTVQGLKPFESGETKFHLKSSNSEVKAYCCHQRGTNYINSTKVMDCCRNGVKKNRLCEDSKSGFEPKSSPIKCADKSMPFHFTYKKSRYTGDGCCDRPVHMAKIHTRCCVTSNSPCQKSESVLPSCCGSGQCNSKFQYNNGPKAEIVKTGVHNSSGEFKLESFFCEDNRSGLWNVTTHLSQDRLDTGSPVKSPVQEIQLKSFPMFDQRFDRRRCCEYDANRVLLSNEICCDKLYDRFGSDAHIRGHCCAASKKNSNCVGSVAQLKCCGREAYCDSGFHDCLNNPRDKTVHFRPKSVECKSGIH